MPRMRAAWKEAAETSIRAPMGRDAKREGEAPMRVETGVGSGAKTGRKRAFDFDVVGSREGVVEAKGRGEGLVIVLAAESWAGTSSIESCQCIFRPFRHPTVQHGGRDLTSQGVRA